MTVTNLNTEDWVKIREKAVAAHMKAAATRARNKAKKSSKSLEFQEMNNDGNK